MARRKGRGRLSSIDILAQNPETQPIVAWAAQELAKRELPQIDILAEFNKRLEHLAIEHNLDIQTISKSAFNRFSIRRALVARRLEETRQIATTLADRFDASENDDLTVMVAQTIKTLVFEILESADEGGIDTKGAMELARAIKHAVEAEHISTDRRKRIEAELAKKAEQAVNAAVDSANKSGHKLSAPEILEKIRDVYGIGR